jgi:hypothetical protein
MHAMHICNLLNKVCITYIYRTLTQALKYYVEFRSRNAANIRWAFVIRHIRHFLQILIRYSLFSMNLANTFERIVKV